MSRFVLAEVLQSDEVLGAVRKEFRRLFDMKPAVDELRGLLVSSVLKRDTLDGEGPKSAELIVRRPPMLLPGKP
jgi:hypothetical protein